MPIRDRFRQYMLSFVVDFELLILELPSFVILVNYCFNKYAHYCNLERNEAKNCFQAQNSMSSTLVDKKHAWTHLCVVTSCLVDELRCTQIGMNTTLKPRV
ncbi:hypothetical protein H5410_055319 [Solanum commersonii]|uniref:Uncharacterized protein n=1 Tax=Solanum commersonii TaxID=4109 RepID=A0A9J5WH95_SOLCO|nr:hypothetical protein H5410_055319 [Solanum commersonii]